jgi:hypothetical protein
MIEDASESIATGHGSMQPYDRLVPVIMAPPGRVAHAPLKQPVTTIHMMRIATVLARWLRVTPPTSLPR